MFGIRPPAVVSVDLTHVGNHVCHVNARSPRWAQRHKSLDTAGKNTLKFVTGET